MNTMAQPLGPSSLPIIGRLVWKNTRRLATFFVAMTALAVGIQCIITWTISNSSNDFGQFGGYTFAALGGFAALFAAACGATSFAAEKEERTFDILQLLPLKSSQLLVGKLLAIIVLSLTFLLLMTLIARFWMPSIQRSWQPFLATFVVGTFEYFAWSLLFSVLLRSPLNAAMAGIFCASASSQIAVYFATGGMNIDYVSLEPYAFAWKTRLAIASVVFAVAVWKAKDWLSSSPTGTQTSARQVSSDQSPAVESELSTFGFLGTAISGLRRCWPGNWMPVLQRLSWQSVRENWIGVSLAYSLTVGSAILLYALNSGTLLIGLILVCIAGGFAGVAALSSDVSQNRSGSSFLAIHGASPNIAWFSRVAPWVLAIALLHVAIAAAILIVVSFLDIPIYSSNGLPLFDIGSMGKINVESNLVGNAQLMAIMLLKDLCVCSLLCFFTGQFVSIIIRSRALAMVATTIVCLPLVVWFGLMLAGEVSILATVLPFIVAFAFAGWFAFRSKLMERLSWKRASLLCGSLAIVPAVLVPAVMHHRANEVPAVEVNLIERDLEKFNSPKTAAKFDAIRVRFSEPLSEVDFQDAFINIEFYKAILQMDGDAIRNNDTKAFERLLDDSAHVYWTEQYDGKPSLAKIKKQTELFLDQHAQQIGKLVDTIDMAHANLALFDSAPPLSFGEGKKERPIPNTYTCQHLLELDFYRHLAASKPNEAWKSLRALTKYRRLQLSMESNYMHWHSRLLDKYSELAVCENQKPELLSETIAFAREHFKPLDWERVLEYERAEMLASLNYNVVHNNGTIRLLHTVKHYTTQIAKRLPCEQERATRLINLWTVYQQNVHRTKVAAKRAVEMWGENHTPQEESGKIRQFMEQYRKWMIQGPRNTILPRKSQGSLYYEMTRYPNLSPFYSHQNRIDADEHRIGTRTKLAILQMQVIKIKLETGEFPSSIDWLLVDLQIKEPVYYYPEGKPHEVYSRLPFHKQWNILGNRDTIPAQLPFLSNRVVSQYPLLLEDEFGVEKLHSVPAFGTSRNQQNDFLAKGSLIVLPLADPNSEAVQ